MDCQVCLTRSTKTHTYGLFTPVGEKKDLAKRRSTLLLVPIERDDGYPQFVCKGCMYSAIATEKKLQALQEKAMTSLDTLKQTATRHPYVTVRRVSSDVDGGQHKQVNALAQAVVTGTRKRPKDTASATGVFPSTVRSRPPSKKLTVKRC